MYLRPSGAWHRLPGLGIVGIFPGDPGGCSRNGCTHETYIDGALEVSHIVKRNIPTAEVELGTWGPPFFGWGIIQAPGDWRGEFIPKYQHTAWAFDKPRAEAAMTYVLKRLPEFPSDTSVAINMGFNGDGNPGGRQDARPWARQIARTNRILTWDYSLTEGENCVCPHYRFERLFERRREEQSAAPYSGGIAYTMTPLLNQLSLFMSAQSFIDPNADHRALAEQFFEDLFGTQGRELVDFMPLFEVIPDWGHYAQTGFSRAAYHAKMRNAVDLLKSLEAAPQAALPFHPTPGEYRRELLFFAELFADLSAPSPDYPALRRRYWNRVYAIYDQLPDHVDPRPKAATDNLIGHFTKALHD